MEILKITYKEIIDTLIEKALANRAKGTSTIVPEFIKNASSKEDFLHHSYQTLATQYEPIHKCKYYEPIEFDIENEKWQNTVSLIAWCIQQLEDWVGADINNINEIKLILNLTYFLDKNGIFWESLKANNISVNNQLIVSVARELSRLRCEYKIDSTVNIPIYERESLDKFLLSISSKNWKDIFGLWQIFKHQPLLTSEHIQMLRILDYFNSNLLVSSLRETNDIPILMQIMPVLRLKTALSIGLETKNDYLEFASVYSALNQSNSEVAFTEEVNTLLVSILSKIKIETEKFTDWMELFNRYPPHFPNIQTALGKMLATTATEENLNSYLKSIILDVHPNEVSRKIISECLIEFAKSADSARRKSAWEKAYEYWSHWNFGALDESKPLFKISFSNLDVAICGYYIECLPEKERLTIKEQLINNMELFQCKWHFSSSAATTYWYQNLSFFQIVVHAGTSKEDAGTWLQETSFYIPSQFNENKYIQMLIG